jgi:hypothetical protein
MWRKFPLDSATDFLVLCWADMKILILGSIKVVNGKAIVPLLPSLIWPDASGSRRDQEMLDVLLEDKDMPIGGWESAINSKLPYRMASLSRADDTYWLCGEKFVKMTECGHLTEEEQKLEIAHFVLRNERRYKKLQQQLEAYRNLERAEVSRREHISDAVRLFVWQRDEGKCVKCGSKERLEFDHIIPIALGGSNTERNIQLLCESCNRSKGTNV